MVAQPPDAMSRSVPGTGKVVAGSPTASARGTQAAGVAERIAPSGRQARTEPTAPRGPFAARGPRKRYPAVRARRGRAIPRIPVGNARRGASRRGTGRARTGPVIPEAGRASSVRAEMAAGVRRRRVW